MSDEWRAEMRIPAAEAALIVDAGAADVMTEMVLWVMLRARRGRFDLFGRQRRRVRTIGWRFFASSRILPPLMLDYEVSPAQHLVTFRRLTLLHSNRISMGTAAEESSLPSVAANRTMQEQTSEIGSQWAFLEFLDVPRLAHRRERDQRAWTVCVAPAYEIAKQEHFSGDVQQALYLLMMHIAMNVDRVHAGANDLLIAELPLASMEVERRLTVAYRVDHSARRAMIVDIAVHTE